MDKGELIMLGFLLMAGGLGWAIPTVMLWKQRAINIAIEMDKAHREVKLALKHMDACEREKLESYEAMMSAFDYINDNQPFASHNEGLMQVRNVLLRAIQTSTHGRGVRP